MKILQVCTYSTGGAAKAALLLHRHLLKNGMEASLLFMETSLSEPGVYSLEKSIGSFRYLLGKIGNKLYPKLRLLGYPETPELYSFPKAFFDITELPIYKEADVVHFHWTPKLVDLPSFFARNKKPVVWTVHDEYLLSGGAHRITHFPFEAFSKLISAYRLFLEKSLSNSKVQFTVPSKWLFSKVFDDEILGKNKVLHLPNGLQPEVFTTKNKLEVRKKLGLPVDKKIILFVADYLDRKLKGMDSLLKVLDLLNASKIENLFCLIAGKGEIVDTITIPSKHLGFVDSESKMADCYNAADVFIMPSYEENLPFTVLESLFCGTPVVSFDVGGISDMLIHEKNGFLCAINDVKSMSNHVRTILSEDKKFAPAEIRQSVVNKFDINNIGDQFLQLYRTL